MSVTDKPELRATQAGVEDDDADIDNAIENSRWGVSEVHQQAPCFYCGKPLTEFPVISWSGWTGVKATKAGHVIVMHPVCANDLVLRLAHDVLTVTQTRGKL